jgi:hypothetical protein
MNWNALRFFVMVIVLCVCVLAAAWALNLGKIDGEFHVCYPEPNHISSLSVRRHTYRVIEIAPQDRPVPDFDPNYPSSQLPQRKYPEQPRIEKGYKIIPIKEHLLRIDED